MLQLSDLKIAVIGLGYVGLPLAVEFGKKVPVVGFDIHTTRIEELKSGQDHTLEVSSDELKDATYLSYSSDLADLHSCNFFIVTVELSFVDKKNREEPVTRKKTVSNKRLLPLRNHHTIKRRLSF